jgi:pimeloyl-ACP methyl ester carboxylesterase
MDVVGYGFGSLFAALAAVRHAKGLHPYGPAFSARVVIDGAPSAPAGSTLLSEPGAHEAILRFSRALGLPAPLPDLLGVGVRVLDAYAPGRHQDILCTSTVDRPLVRRIFLPARGFGARPYSSGVSYRAGGETFRLGVVPAADRTLWLACSAGGPFERIGRVEVGARLPEAAEALRMHPFNCGGGLEPVGFVNRLRDYAYPLSQAARTA